MSVIIKLLSKFDDSGLKHAKKGFGGLKKTIGAIGLGVGIAQVTDLLMDSAKAASADAKSQKLLNSQITKNTGATKGQIKQNDKFLDSLSQQVGIFDDDLRPAMGKLVRGTGSLSKAQQLLKLSLDASAVSGKPLDAVATAMSKAFNGNTTSLIRMFPELKKSKDLFGDLAKTVEGTAVQQATPFDKFNVAMDNLKEKLGAVVLPLITDFIDQMMKPGGAIDQVGQFLEDLTNPKTDAGKMFTDIKNAVKDAFGYVRDFFALFGGGDAMKGFSNVASTLISALPALLALKGILMLASAGKSIANLAKAIALMTGAGAAGDGTILGGGKNKTGKFGNKFPLLGGGALLGAGLVLMTSGDTMIDPERQAFRESLDPKTGYPKGHKFDNIFGQKPLQPLTNNNITIQVQSADPKAVVDAVSKYAKQNGGLPSVFFPGGKK